jgi:hypothetical protein
MYLSDSLQHPPHISHLTKVRSKHELWVVGMKWQYDKMMIKMTSGNKSKSPILILLRSRTAIPGSHCTLSICMRYHKLWNEELDSIGLPCCLYFVASKITIANKLTYIRTTQPVADVCQLSTQCPTVSSLLNQCVWTKDWTRTERVKCYDIIFLAKRIMSLHLNCDSNYQAIS